MTQEKMNRISELTRLSRGRKLTQEEQTERAALRQEYMAEMRGSLRAHLDSITVQTPDGKLHPLKKPPTPNEPPAPNEPQGVRFVGEVVRVEEPGAQAIMSVLMKPLGGGEEVLFHISPETRLCVEQTEIVPGAQLELVERGVRTMSIPPQGAALEVRAHNVG